MQSLKKNLLSMAIFASGLTCVYAANPYGLADECQKGVILHCFNQKYSDIKEQLPQIAEAGFSSVQISSPQTPAEQSGPWWWFYQPLNFKIEPGSDFGTKEEFLDLIKTARDEYNIKVIVDVVANHLADQSLTPPEDYYHFHTPGNLDIAINYGSRESVTQDRLVQGIPDLKTESPKVQNMVREFVDALHEAGVAGIRWDATKHIAHPSENLNGVVDNFWNVVLRDDMYNYAEILGTDANQPTKEYSQLMSMTDNQYGNKLTASFASGNVEQSIGVRTLAGIDADRLVYWGESHDTYSNDNGETKNVSQSIIDKGYSVVAARSWSTALYFARPVDSNGNELKGKDDIVMGAKGSDNYFTNPAIRAVNRFHDLTYTETDYIEKSGNCYSVLKHSGAVIVRADNNAGQVTVTNGGQTVEPGEYLDQVSGNIFTVTEDAISGATDESGIAVITRFASVSASPESGFRGESQSITLTAINADESTYSINDSEPVTFNGTVTIEIGEGDPIGTNYTITWTATKGDRSNSGTYTYTKQGVYVAPVIYFHNTLNWTRETYHAYIYDDSGATKVENSSWPGEAMTFDPEYTWDGKTGWWKYEVPEKVSNGLVIINAGTGGNAAHRYPADQEPGISIGGDALYFTNDNNWDYESISPVQLNAFHSSANILKANQEIQFGTSLIQKYISGRPLSYSFKLNGENISTNSTQPFFTAIPQKGKNTVSVTITDGLKTYEFAETYFAAPESSPELYPDYSSSASDATDCVYILGGINGWKAENVTKLPYNPETDTYNGSIDWEPQSGSNLYFRIWDSKPAAASGGYGPTGGKDTEIKPNTTVTCKNGVAVAWYVKPGSYQLIYDKSTHRITIIDQNTETLQVPEILDTEEPTLSVRLPQAEGFTPIIIDRSGRESAATNAIDENGIWKSAIGEAGMTVHFFLNDNTSTSSDIRQRAATAPQNQPGGISFFASIPEILTNISQCGNSDVHKVICGKGFITALWNDDTVASVYSANGILAGNLSKGETVYLPSGIYIIHSGSGVIKAVVR